VILEHCIASEQTSLNLYRISQKVICFLHFVALVANKLRNSISKPSPKPNSIITHAGIAAGVGRAFSRVCLSVCLSVWLSALEHENGLSYQRQTGYTYTLQQSLGMH